MGIKSGLKNSILIIILALALFMFCACAGDEGDGAMAPDGAPSGDMAAGENALANADSAAYDVIIDTKSFVNAAQLREKTGVELGDNPFFVPDGRTADGGEPYIAAVGPHHLLAAEYLAQVLSRLAAQEPPLIIIIGPNHANSGPPAQSVPALWQTVAGDVATDLDAYAALLAGGLVHQKADTFATEHSIGMMMPFIAHYLPEAKVLPIALHYQYPLEDGKKILESLAPWLEEGAVILGSIDFSHGLSMLDAQNRDDDMAEALISGDSSLIAKMGNEYLDSPTIMALIIEYARAKGVSQPIILTNINSGYLMRNETMECTSYFTLLY